MADLRFGAWAQSAIGQALEQADDGGPTLGAPELKPKATMRGPGVRQEVARAQPVTMLGPGDVQGLDARVIGRSFPAPGTGDARTNDLVAVELTAPEVPWLLTPARPGRHNHLRPWMVLVAVEMSRSFDAAARPLPVLRVRSKELPDLGESWAWAHVQYAPDADHGIARLLCPRKLAPNTRYRACVVPAFEGGRVAGLGVSGPKTRNNARAWDAGADGEVSLPVYHWWEFGTGEEGDFEDCVRRLKPAEPVAGMGSQEVDISRPWPSQSVLSGAEGPLLARVDGAMRPIRAATADPPQDPVPREARRNFEERLTHQVNLPADRLDGTHDPNDRTGAVAPPIYGGRHAGVDRVIHIEGPTLVPEGWVVDLNISPANRVAAGLGADYVRANQEELMARAWEQVGEIREGNRRRALGELATEVAASVHRRHVETLLPGELVAMAAPAAARIRTSEPTLAMTVTASTLPDAAMSSSFARFMRPSGPVARKTGSGVDSLVSGGLSGEKQVPDPAPVLLDQAAEAVASGTPRGAAERLVLLDAVRRVADANGLESAAGMLGEKLGAVADLEGEAVAIADVDALAPVLADQMEAVQAAMQAITELPFSSAPAGDGRVVEPTGVPIGVDDLTVRLRAGLAPGDQVERRLESAIAVPSTIDAAGLGPLMSYPRFELPMAMALLATAPEWFLPGLGDFPSDRTTLLEANDAFIESYLIGLNQEMMSELLWREYPTDRRGTPFQRFWPRPLGQTDIAAIDTWPRQSVLGDHSELGGEAFSILLVRGEVVRRYPDMIVTAVRAVAPAGGGKPNLSTDPADVRTAVFVLPIDPSTAAYAFPVPPAEVSAPMMEAAPGWFFVFQEHDYRMRFGFDLANTEFTSWDDLSWEMVADARGFARIGRGLDDPDNPADLHWKPTADSTQIARIALQKPFRIAMHATLLIQPVGG